MPKSRQGVLRHGSVTIEDVAREAGVSRSTVSLVLRESPLVAGTTRRQVQAVMSRLGYVPNRLAASLRGVRSFILGLVVTDLTFPHYAQMAVGVEAAVEGAGYSLIVANSHESLERERLHVQNLRRYRADGLLITPVQTAIDHLQDLCEEGYPCVTLTRRTQGLETDFCGPDGYAGMRELVGYLAGALGHRRIAILSGTQRTSTSLDRLAGWRAELQARGLPASDSLVVAHAANAAGGEHAAEVLLQRGVPFTAVACVNDLVAVGAMRAFHRAGRAVPQEISVSGMGGFADVSPPDKPLTTVIEDYKEIGRRAGELILRRLDHAAGDRPSTPQRLVVP
ncbi:MAG TPA: LacI family DNA-binding transcriptional regulator, partial [Chloroflexota bacterium]|nr:LacI family DNA-binding transcriptional regulator [Chloroflexota bacterium]